MTPLHPVHPRLLLTLVLGLLLVVPWTTLAANTQPEILSSPNLNAQAGIGYAYDVDARDPDANPLSYLLLAAPSGVTIDGSTGMVSWTPENLGSFPVAVAVDDGQGGRTTQSYDILVAPGPVVSLRIQPENSTLTADETITLQIFAADRLGHEYAVPTAMVTVADPAGSVTADGVYHPGRSGTWEMTALLGSLRAGGTATVIPGRVATLLINPNTNPEMIAIGAARQFTVVGFDADNNPITDLPVRWEVLGSIGSISANGTFTATKAGTGRIQATFGDLHQDIAVEVRGQGAPTRPGPIAQSENANTTVTNEPEETITNTPQEQEEGAVAGAATEETPAAETCVSLAWWGWLLVTVGYVVVLGLYYYLVRSWRSGYWWIFPTLLTAAALWAFATYRCGETVSWWPWVTIILGILATLFRPHRFESPMGQTIA